MDSRPPTAARSRLEVVAAALADQGAHADIVVRDARAAPAAPAGALDSLLVEARADAAAARDELAARVAGEAELVAIAGRLRLELDELRERLAARDERDARVAGLVAEVADAARDAREEVQRHAEARERAELDLAAARERLAALDADLEAERARAAAAEQALGTELEAAHSARDRALAAEDAASAAREAELSALKAAHAALRPAPAGEPATEQLADGLARAEQRLRDARPPVPAPTDADRPPAPAAPVAAADAPAPAAPALSVGAARPRHGARSGLLRRLFRRRR